MIKKVSPAQQKKLLSWFEKNKRDLPWRKTKDPYKIWISEVLLQQTTSKAVIPYYKKMMAQFPHLPALARAKKEDLFLIWAGLGYYKRAESLLTAGKALKKMGAFPQTYKALLNLPGFGPYTARAVSSLAFEEPVGVLDGNVIRFLSRFYAIPFKWWEAKDKAKLQKLSNLWVKSQKASQMNQALMEIGALICLSKNPLCLLCPLSESCLARQKGLLKNLPLKKAKKPVEFWHYQPKKIKNGSQWAFAKNKSLPFLKGKWLFPGEAKKIKNKPEAYDFAHSIMNYQIFVTVQKTKNLKKRNKNKPFFKTLESEKNNISFPVLKKPWRWLGPSQITSLNPSSLIQKIFDLEK